MITEVSTERPVASAVPEPIEITGVLAELHVPPAVTSDKVTDCPRHILSGPIIGPGLASMVTLRVMLPLQPLVLVMDNDTGKVPVEGKICVTVSREEVSPGANVHNNDLPDEK